MHSSSTSLLVGDGDGGDGSSSRSYSGVTGRFTHIRKISETYFKARDGHDRFKQYAHIANYI